MRIHIGQWIPAARWAATYLYFPTRRRSQSSEQYSQWYNMKGQHENPFFRVKPVEKQRIIKEISKEFQRNVKEKPMENWFQSLWNFWVFMLTFHIVPSRVLLGSSRATARWKVEARSCPTRCWNPLSDVYTHSYGRCCPEKKSRHFSKKGPFFKKRIIFDEKQFSWVLQVKLRKKSLCVRFSDYNSRIMR